MPRSLDHLVIPAHDLAAQAETYRRLGFQVGARNRHPWGTENHIVQFDGAFLELIGLGDGFEAPPAQASAFSFASFVADYLDQGQGLAMLVIASNDSEADRRGFAQRGLGDFDRFDFARKARKPDGREVDVAFSLAFAAAPALPRTGFFVCEQKFTENFWNSAAQIHPNGAVGVTGLGLTHDRPAETVAFLSAFLDAPPLAQADGFVFQMKGTRLTVSPANASARALGVEPASLTRTGLSAMEIAVENLTTTAELLRANGVAFQPAAQRLVVDPNATMGAILAFVARE